MGALTSKCTTCCKDEPGARQVLEAFDESGFLVQEVDDREAQPQVLPPDMSLGGPELGEIWPEFWGVSVAQFRELIDNCRQDEKWNHQNTMQDLVNSYIVPLTRGKGVGYALYRNGRTPKEVNVVVSNCWLENAEAFCEKLERSVREDDVLFICALALYQCEDGAGPTIKAQLGTTPEQSPFLRVLKHVKRLGDRESWVWHWHQQIRMLPTILATLALAFAALPMCLRACVPFRGKCAVGTCTPAAAWLPVFVWHWQLEPLEPGLQAAALAALFLALCAGVLWATLRIWPLYGGCMLAVPNHLCDVYAQEVNTSRSGCDCYGGLAQEADPGVCMVKLELYSARSLGVPLRLANSVLPSEESRRERGPGAVCMTKTDTQRLQREAMKNVPEAPADELSAWCQQSYDVVNHEAHVAILEAHRLALLAEVVWAAAVLLSTACAVRLLAAGVADWLEEQHVGAWLPSTAGAAWSWWLLFGALLGLVLSAATMVGMAWAATGHTSSRGWWFAAAGLAAAAVALFALQLAVTPLVNPGAAWCLTGVQLGLWQGVQVILILVAIYHQRGTPCVSSGMCRQAGGCFVVVLVLATITTAGGWSLDHLYPTFMVAFLGLFAFLLGPCIAAWLSVQRWGVMVDRGTKDVP